VAKGKERDFRRERYPGMIAAIATHRGLPPVPEDWHDVDAVLPLLEQMRREGAVVMLKLDGQRDRQMYTALVSGGPLGPGEFFRTDAESLEDALAYIIIQYAQSVWHFAAPESEGSEV